jgi:carboxyl-terminal processing protease
MEAAAVPALDRGRIGDVVEMAVGEQEQVDAFSGEMGVGALRGVDEDIAGGAAEEEGVRREDAAAKFFEPNHENVVSIAMRSLIFPQGSANLFRMRLLASALVLVFLAGPAWSADLDKVAVSVARLLEQGHYSRQKLDDEVSAKLLDQYLQDLDPNKLFFTQGEVDALKAKYATTLDDAILGGNLDPARDIFGQYKQHVIDRVALNKALADKKYNFTTRETVALNRKDAPWPKSKAEAQELWRKRIEAELLQETLNKHAVDSPAKVVKRRQDQLLRNLNEMDDESIVSGFLGALARSYDPHSEYMSPSELANFEIEMKKSLDGVGAVLQSEDGYAKIKEIVPGGPADLDGHLKVNDRIAAVAQGNAPFEDVVDMKLDKVVEKIRGKRGTVVRLQVIPASASDPSKRAVIAIRRDEVKLKDQKASAEIIDLTRPNGRPLRLGWIELPSFYADLNRGSDDPDAVSTTKDVSMLLDRLKKEGIQGLVIDLRRDGGGSLEEAINLTGLFIPKGPVVQSKDSNGKVAVSYDKNALASYDGPLVVVTNRLSASASEIFAAALQDYGRAVIVGDERSFGKGTVQTMLDIGRFMPFFSLGSADAGALKLTINKFYRVLGGSTQLEGVKSNIVLPSLTDNPEFGEGSLPHPLPYDEVAPQRIDRNDLTPVIGQLQALSSQRVAADPEFRYISEDMARMRKRYDDNTVSLNLADRKRELSEDNARREARMKERAQRGAAIEAVAYEVTLDNVEKPTLDKVAFDRKKKGSLFEASDDDDGDSEADTKDVVIPDAIRNEALRINADMVDLLKSSKTASTQTGSRAVVTP